jgi:hypothetical protein
MVDAVDLYGFSEAHAQRSQPGQAVGPGYSRRDEWCVRALRDPGRSCVGLRLVLLHEPFSLARSVREHHDDVALTDELDGGLHRLDVALATPDAEGAP